MDALTYLADVFQLSSIEPECTLASNGSLSIFMIQFCTFVLCCRSQLLFKLYEMFSLICLNPLAFALNVRTVIFFLCSCAFMDV